MGKLTLFGDVLVPELRDGFLVAIISRHHPAPVGHKHQIITKSAYVFFTQILIFIKNTVTCEKIAIYIYQFF